MYTQQVSPIYRLQAALCQIGQGFFNGLLYSDTLFHNMLDIRAGEFTKKKLYHGKKRVFGPKDAPKKRGSPTPNFPPPQFGK